MRLCEIPDMFGIRMSSVFRSRWMALLWAAGIIWFAYDFAGSQPQSASNDANVEQPTDVTGTPITPEDQKRFAAAWNSF